MQAGVLRFIGPRLKPAFFSICCGSQMAYKRGDGAVSVSAPRGFAEAFKRLALERTGTAVAGSRCRRIWAQDLHEEAVRHLLDRLARGDTVAFVSTPFRKRTRKAMWLDRTLYNEVKEAADNNEVSISTVVLTACLDFLAAHGIVLDRDNSTAP